MELREGESVERGVDSLSGLFQINRAALMKRYEQGWLMEWTDDVDACLDRIK